LKVEKSKDKSLEKSLNTLLDIDYIVNEKMKTVVIGQTRYYINGKDDMISVAHELAKKGYSLSQIASFLGVSERTVKHYMAECW